jgi:hypothetical protein
MKYIFTILFVFALSFSNAQTGFTLADIKVAKIKGMVFEKDTSYFLVATDARFTYLYETTTVFIGSMKSLDSLLSASVNLIETKDHGYSEMVGKNHVAISKAIGLKYASISSYTDKGYTNLTKNQLLKLLAVCRK